MPQTALTFIKSEPFEKVNVGDAYSSGAGAAKESAKEMVEGLGQAAAGGLAHIGRNRPEKIPDIDGTAETQEKINRGDVDVDATRPGPTLEERLNDEPTPHNDPSMPSHNKGTETREAPRKRNLESSQPVNGDAQDSTDHETSDEGSDDEEELQPNGRINGNEQKATRVPSHLSINRLKNENVQRRPSFAESVGTGSTMSDDHALGRNRSLSTASTKDTYHFGSKKHRFSVSAQRSNMSQSLPAKPPTVTPDIFEDPLNPDFYERTWMKAAILNTEIFRKVSYINVVFLKARLLIEGH